MSYWHWHPLNLHEQIRKFNYTLNFTSKYFAQNCREKMIKYKTDIFKKKYTDSLLNQIYLKKVLKTIEIARP